MINCFIQARTNSSRLYGKTTMPVNGVPLVVGLYRKLTRCRNVDHTVVLIPRNDGLKELPINFFEGPEHDVARRFSLALGKYPCDGFVRVCADSPFVSPAMVDACAVLTERFHYALLSLGRSGLQVEAFQTEAFLESEPYMTGDEREHLGLFFKRGRSLSIDTQEDYDRLKDIPL